MANKMANLANLLESYAKALLERQTELPADQITLLHRAIEVIEQLLAGGGVDEDNQPTVLDHESLVAEPLSSNRLHTINLGVEALAGGTSLEPPVLDTPDEFLAIFLEEAKEILEKTQSLVERWKDAPHNNMPLLKELQRELHTLKGGARMVGITALGELTHSLESVLTQMCPV